MIGVIREHNESSARTRDFIPTRRDYRGKSEKSSGRLADEPRCGKSDRVCPIFACFFLLRLLATLAIPCCRERLSRVFCLSRAFIVSLLRGNVRYFESLRLLSHPSEANSPSPLARRQIALLFHGRRAFNAGPRYSPLRQNTHRRNVAAAARSTRSVVERSFTTPHFCATTCETPGPTGGLFCAPVIEAAESASIFKELVDTRGEFPSIRRRQWPAGRLFRPENRIGRGQ